MIPSRSRHAPPKATALIESLRGLGYSAPTALADLIDNSISARATHVALLFHWAGANSHIRILDDGDGMSDASLDLAMRLGERNPLSERHPDDMGRFGLGLKTASFSQCRRLTVASNDGNATNCLRWDLDVLASSTGDGWCLLEGPDQGSAALLEPLEHGGKGTLVLWEVLDRIVSPGFTEQDFLDLMDRVEQHLSMVFHRFLEGPDPTLAITLNGRKISPWDPFLMEHPATWSSPVERLHSVSGTVEIQCHVLPHKDKLEPGVHEVAAGRDGWTSQQGFYIYRNKRLLVSGNWLGLGQGRPWSKEEAYRLARIRVDIPNSADQEWRIDIRKSVARPPISVKARLTRLAEDTRERARRVFAHRGQAARHGGLPVAQAWRVERTSTGMRYRIDRDHPAVKAVLEEASNLLPLIQAMIRVVEETVPVQRIWLDTTEGKETPRTGFSGEAPAEVTEILQVMYRNMVLLKGLAPEDARRRLLNTEPFHNFPELVSELGRTDLGNEIP